MFRFQDLFTPFKIKTMKETTLGANKWLNESKRLDFPTGEDLTNVIMRDIKKSLSNQGFSNHGVVTWLEGHERYGKSLRGENDVPKNYYEYILGNLSEEKPSYLSQFSVLLNPMEIRTFVIEIEKNK